MNVAQLRAALDGVPDRLDVVVVDDTHPDFEDGESSWWQENLVVDCAVETSETGGRYFGLHVEPWTGTSIPSKPPK